MESKFKIGDKVDFVNDYGVKFENLIITGIDEDYKDEVRYFLAPLEPSFEKWHHSYEEKNLHEAGTEVKVESDLELNNGSIAVFQKYNDNYNKIFKIDYNGNKITSVLVDGSLHTINDYDEPMNALAPLFQPVSVTSGLENLDNNSGKTINNEAAYPDMIVKYNEIKHKQTNESQKYLIQTMGFILEKGEYSFEEFNAKALEYSSSPQVVELVKEANKFIEKESFVQDIDEIKQLVEEHQKEIKPINLTQK